MRGQVRPPKQRTTLPIKVTLRGRGGGRGSPHQCIENVIRSGSIPIEVIRRAGPKHRGDMLVKTSNPRAQEIRDELLRNTAVASDERAAALILLEVDLPST